MLCLAQFLSGEFAGVAGGEDVGGLVEVDGDFLQGEHVATTGTEGAFATTGAGELLEVVAQGVEAGAGFRRGP